MEVLKGKIFSGMGVGGKIILDYLPVFKEKFRMDFFPGTLNLKLENEWDLPAEAGYIQPFTKADGTRRGGIWFVKGKVKNFPVFVIRPELTKHPKDVIELISPVNIRKQYALVDGDILEVYF